MRLVDVPKDSSPESEEFPVDESPRNPWVNQAPKTPARTTPSQGKRGRASMPSWDEIVFGARTDDDLA